MSFNLKELVWTPELVAKIFPVTHVTVTGFEMETPKEQAIFKIAEGFNSSIIEDYKLSCNCGNAMFIDGEFRVKMHALNKLADTQKEGSTREVYLEINFNDGKASEITNFSGGIVPNPEKAKAYLHITIVTKPKPKA